MKIKVLVAQAQPKKENAAKGRINLLGTNVIRQSLAGQNGKSLNLIEVKGCLL